MDIVEEIRKDRESGARRLESEYKAGLMTLARRFCADEGDAEELVNRTFAEVIEGIDDYLEQSAFFAWMCQILVNLHKRDSKRKSNRTVTYPGDVPEIVDEDAQEAIYRNLDYSMLRDAIAGMPTAMRELLLLHYFMEIPIPKLAKILAVPAGTVKSRLHYARGVLAAKMGAAAKKPGGKAVLLALLLCGVAALGAVVTNWWGVSSRRAGEAAQQQAGNSSQLPSTAIDSTAPDSIRHPSTAFDLSSGEQTMNATTQRSAAMLAAALAMQTAGPLAASGDEYQYIVSGDPVAAATAGCASGESATGPLDVRRCAVAESRAMALTSIKNTGFVIVIR